MNVATILIPGTGIPYHVVDYAISWARENEGSLHALFLVSGEVPDEAYPFPNDLDEAEALYTEVDAKKGIRKILQEETRFIEKRAKASHIPIRTEVLFSPKIEEVLTRINQSEITFIDKTLNDEGSISEELSFTLEDLREKGTRDLFGVGEYDR